VWNQENQWEPLWADITRVAQRLLAQPDVRHHPHFLGAVVVQQVQNPTGSMQERTIIDGQQRMTTLQLLLDALHAELALAGASQPAMRLEALVTNAEAFWEHPQDRFKLWPTNRDRAAFNSVMSAEPPVDHDTLPERGARLLEAHRFFSVQARDWLHLDGPADIARRAATLERTVRELVQMVVIDLTAEENAQEIFETLNARGAQLTAADLIKNFVFQRLTEHGVDVEQAYEKHWKQFETAFWETEISFGRVHYPRSSAFLNQWLIAKTGEEIVAREIFARFKTYADHDAGVSMDVLLARVSRAAGVYQRFVQAAATLTGPLDRLELFAYRTGVLESEVIKPLVLFLLDPDDDAVPEDQLRKTWDVVESWLVRRMLVRVTSKSYTQVVAELITVIRKEGRQHSGDVVERYFGAQTGANRYWPDDQEVEQELQGLAVYRRLSRGRLRMVLEAVEDHRRGWGATTAGLGGERITRGKMAIEHVLPRAWQRHWRSDQEVIDDAEREELLHTLGNLTLLTTRLNSTVSNSAWLGEKGKRQALAAHDVLILNRDLLALAGESWDHRKLRERTARLTASILTIWPVPAGHRSGYARAGDRSLVHKIDIADLMTGGALQAGMTLYARRKQHLDRTAVLLADGGFDVDGVRYGSPSGAARAVTGSSENGWSFWLVDKASRQSLTDVWHDYVDEYAVDVADVDTPESADEP
jgi:hypothetical protein